MKVNRDNEKALEDIIIDEEENIYQKLARTTARAIDIELGKTTLADLLDGYTKSRILQQENKQLKNILTELEEWLKEEQERYRDYLSTRPENDSEYNSKYATQCGLAQVDVILDKIQELKEKFDERR